MRLAHRRRHAHRRPRLLVVRARRPGTPVGVVYVATDVTERKRAEKRCATASTATAPSSRSTRCRCGSTTIETLALHRRQRRGRAALRLLEGRVPADDASPTSGRPKSRRRLRAASTAVAGRRRPAHRPRHRKRTARSSTPRSRSFEFVDRRPASRLVIAVDVTERWRRGTAARERRALPAAVRAQPRRRLSHHHRRPHPRLQRRAWRASSAIALARELHGASRR